MIDNMKISLFSKITAKRSLYSGSQIQNEGFGVAFFWGVG
jgi:hypothetical protein